MRTSHDQNNGQGVVSHGGRVQNYKTFKKGQGVCMLVCMYVRMLVLYIDIYIVLLTV